MPLFRRRKAVPPAGRVFDIDRLEPGDIDIWAMRDSGYVDRDGLEVLRNRFGVTEALVVDYELEPDEHQKQRVIEHYEELASHLNREAFDGRRDWTPRQAWSLSRAATAKQWGRDPSETRLPIPWPKAEPLSSGTMTYDLEHIEDWDFAEQCESPPWRLSGDAATFVQSMHVLARDSVRTQLIGGIVESGDGLFDGTFVKLTGSAANESDTYLYGLQHPGNEDETATEILESLRREYRRDGRLRLTRLPRNLDDLTQIPGLTFYREDALGEDSPIGALQALIQVREHTLEELGSPRPPARSPRPDRSS